MNPITVGIIGFVALFVLLTIGLPIGVTMGVIGAAGLWYLLSGPSAMMKMTMASFETVSSYDWTVLPLFLLMAEVCFQSGLSRDLYKLAAKWLGQFRGGMALATIGASAAFSAISSATVATAVTIGTVALPELKNYKYDSGLSTGALVAGGALSILIPPSSFFIYYGLITETSIGDLFVAGIIPGLILTFLYFVAVYILCKFNAKLGPAGPRSSFKEKLTVFGSNVEIILLIVLILGGLVIGWFTPSEAGAVGAFGAIIFTLLRRRLNWQKFKPAVAQMMKTTGMIYAMLIGAKIFIPFMSVTQIPFFLSDFVVGLGVSPYLVMVVIIIMYMILGTFMDEATMMFSTLPVISPVVFALGFDPVWFGVMVTILMMTATISPPVGINLFAVSGIAPDVPMSSIYRGSIPFIIANISIIILILFVPKLALFLPGLSG